MFFNSFKTYPVVLLCCWRIYLCYLWMGSWAIDNFGSCFCESIKFDIYDNHPQHEVFRILDCTNGLIVDGVGDFEGFLSSFLIYCIIRNKIEKRSIHQMSFELLSMLMSSIRGIMSIDKNKSKIICSSWRKIEFCLFFEKEAYLSCSSWWLKDCVRSSLNCLYDLWHIINLDGIRFVWKVNYDSIHIDLWHSSKK